MVIGNKDRILVTSAAAGPAFEGGNITHGIGSVPGAICGIELSGEEIKLKTIRDEAPVGICGTGTIEIVHELLDAGITPMTTDDAYMPQAFGIHLARMLGTEQVKKVVSEGLWAETPEVLKTAKAFEKLAAKGYFSNTVATNTFPTGQNTEFATGSIAMYVNGTWLPNEVRSITGDTFEWGFFNYPEVEGGINGTEAMVVGCQSFAITDKCVNREVAFALVEKLTRGTWDAELAQSTMGLPIDSTNTKWPVQLMDAKPYFDACTEIFAVSGGLESNANINPALKGNLAKLYAGLIDAETFVTNMEVASQD